MKYPKTNILTRPDLTSLTPAIRESFTSNDIEVLSSNTGSLSSFRIKKDKNYVYPFIDYSKYDFERKNFYLEDDDGLFYYLCYGEDLRIKQDYHWTWANKSDAYYIIDIYDIFKSRYDEHQIMGMIDKNKIYFDTKRNRSYYSLVTKPTPLSLNDNTIFYHCNPIDISVSSIVLEDITNYDTMISDSRYMYFNPNKNQFYYGFDGVIYTNLNLEDATILNSLKISCYVAPTDISVNCQMYSYNSGDNNITPIVDYYILNLFGQDFKR